MRHLIGTVQVGKIKPPSSLKVCRQCFPANCNEEEDSDVFFIKNPFHFKII
jgi:hypothetical protein